MIRVRGLSKSYRDGARTLTVLDGVGFELDAGASLCVTGPSGSGKSTLLNVLAGVLAADAGEVILEVDGVAHALHAMSERERTRLRRRNIGYVHQFFNLIPTLTVLENVMLPAELNQRPARRRAARDMLEYFGLEDRADTFPEVLSGGEQQRVAVARSLVIEPALLLADEPTGNLDAENADHVAALLFRAAGEFGASLVVATHSEGVAERADARLALAAR